MAIYFDPLLAKLIGATIASLEARPHIRFEDHENGNEFKVIIARTYMFEEVADDPVAG